MAKTHRPRTRDSKGGHDGRGPSDKEPYDNEPNEREELDDPGEHLEIERRRFIGGEPPTPELYARARAQWNRLPGALARPSMAEGETPGEDPPTPPPTGKKDGQGGDR
jgi:hypothetical protein